MIRIEDLSLSILTKTTVIPEFKSKDGDLNEFLMQEAKDYQEQLLAVTYLLQNPKTGDIVAYFSLLNDTIKFEEDNKKTRNRINRKIPYVKQRNHYPAVKIGRLAVSENYAHQGIGEQILQYVKALFAFGNRSGCRFLTVDAYADAVSFYENKGGFKFFTETDINDDTRLLYFDLKPFKDALETVEKQS